MPARTKSSLQCGDTSLEFAGLEQLGGRLGSSDEDPRSGDRVVQSQRIHHGDLQVVGEASNGPQALDICRSLSPDLVIMDLMLPGLGGLEVTRQLKESMPGLRILILSMHHELVPTGHG